MTKLFNKLNDINKITLNNIIIFRKYIQKIISFVLSLINNFEINLFNYKNQNLY